MPVDALPVPNAAGLPGSVTYRHAYRDPLGRPMSGVATITGSVRIVAGHTTVVPVTVTAKIADGLLEVTLPPGEYRIVAALRTKDGRRAPDTHTVTLDAARP